MVYVIKSGAFDENDNLIQLIKIGYSENFKKRFELYKTDNPTIRILYTFEEGTINDEGSLHQYFERYKFSSKNYSGKEWFNYNEDIINFFKNNTTIEEVRKYFKPTKLKIRYLNKNRRKERRKLIYQYSYFASTLISSKTSYDFRNLLLKTEKVIDLDDVRAWFKQNYPSEFSEIDKKYSDYLNKSDNEKIKGFFKMYNKLPDIPKKLRYLCESSLSSEFIKSAILPNIKEPHFDEYYTILGPERCRALGCNVTKLKKELGVIIFSTELLEAEIYKEFKENQRITNADAKQKLQSIYDLVGYSKKAKATDLSKYFETREIVLVSPKRARGFELLKKK